MLVLLPPSEGKTAPIQGSTLRWQELSHQQLTSARRQVMSELARVSSAPDALENLGVGATLTAEVERNTVLEHSPTAPAHQVYSGVLFNAAEAASWKGQQLANASERIRVVSALFGLVSPGDAIPAYRLSMSTKLGSLGALGTWWKKQAASELDSLADGKLVIDCRSSAYGQVWTRKGSVVNVRVERESAGKRTVVSHMAKHTRGLLTGALMSVQDTDSPEVVADHALSLRAHGITTVELADTKHGNMTLTLVLKED